MSKVEAGHASSHGISGKLPGRKLTLDELTRHDDSEPLDVIQQHLFATLKTISERLLELQGEVKQLSQETKAADKLSKQRTTKIEDTLPFLTKSATEAKASVKAHSQHLEKLDEQFHALHTDKEATKDSLSKLSNGVAALASSSSDSQDALNLVILKQRESLDALTGRVSKAETGIADLSQCFEGVNSRHIDMLKDHRELKKAKEDAVASMQQMEALSKRLRKEQEELNGELSSRTEALESDMRSVQLDIKVSSKRLQDLGMEMKTTQEELQRCAASNNHLEAELTDILGREEVRLAEEQERQQKAATQTYEQMVKEREAQEKEKKSAKGDSAHGRLSKLEFEVRMLSDSWIKGRTSIEDEIKDVSNSLATTSSDVTRIDAEQKIQGNHGELLEARVTAVETEQNGLASKGEEARGAIADLARSHQELKNAVDAQDAANESHNKLMEQNVGEVIKGAQSLERDMEAMKQAVAKSTTRSEKAHEYFQGLGQGVREMHRRLAGEEGILPSATDKPTFGALPTLVADASSPRTPRPASAKSRARTGGSQAWG